MIAIKEILREFQGDEKLNFELFMAKAWSFKKRISQQY